MSLSTNTSNGCLSAATIAALLGLTIADAVAQGTLNSRGEVGAAPLREKLILSEATISALTESLAVANGETELFKRKSEDLNQRIEALGLDPQEGENGTQKLRDRLIAAVRDLRLVQSEKDAAKEQLARLSESVLGILKTTEGIDAKSRLKVEEDLRSVSFFLQKESKVTSSELGLSNGSIVDYKPDMSLVVSNLGADQGVKIGMPFQVWRGDRQVASVRVVDVRKSLSGAIVQSSNPSETVQSGDSLRIDTTR